MMKQIVQWLVVGLILSCGGNKASYDSDNPNNYPYESGPSIISKASFQIGSIQRSFVHQHNVSCINDKNRNETVILFNDETSGSTLSVRMAQIDLSDSFGSRSYNVVANPGEDSFILAINSDKVNGVFRLQANSSANYVPNCQINYTLDSWQMNASFRCYSMTSRSGQIQEAQGEWSCKVQSEDQWQW